MGNCGNKSDVKDVVTPGENQHSQHMTIYFHPISQPSRAVVNFCAQNKLAFTPKVIDLMKGEQKAPEFQKINPLGQVPCLDDNGFVLAESIAILKYLASTKKVSANWYPKDAKKAAKIDEFLNWFPLTLRKNCAGLVYNKVIAPMRNIPPNGDPAEIEKELGPQLATLQDQFMTKGFVASDCISIADMMAFHEVIQLLMVNYDFSPYPKLKAYLKKMLTYPDGFFGMLEKSAPELAKEWNC